METDVLIVGAGPTGLVLGIELARRGVRIRLVDKADRYFGGSRADGIQPRTLEVFDDRAHGDRDPLTWARPRRPACRLGWFDDQRTEAP